MDTGRMVEHIALALFAAGAANRVIAVCVDLQDMSAPAHGRSRSVPGMARRLTGPGSALHSAGLPGGSPIVLEKQFGKDLTGAVELNRLLAGIAPEQAISERPAYSQPLNAVLGGDAALSIRGDEAEEPWRGRAGAGGLGM